MRNADVLLVTSDETRADYVKAYPEIVDKTFTIYNGFDLPHRGAASEKFEKFTIIDTGQFYIYARHARCRTISSSARSLI